MRRCFLLLIAVIIASLLTSCNGFVGEWSVRDPESCNMNSTVAHKWPSPDGKLKAFESRFDCPGWYALKIEITKPDGTKAVALDDRPVDQLRPNRWPDLKVEWRSDRELWITYPARQDTICISEAAGVTVHCVDGTVLR